MSWLLRDDDVLAAVEPRNRGWRRQVQGAVLLRVPAVVQTFTAPRPLDLAWCARSADSELVVRRIVRLEPFRCALPRLRPGMLVVASGGAFERWNLRVGDHLEVRSA
jgi:hypothetical protein